MMVTKYSYEIDFDRKWNGLYFCGLISSLLDNGLLPTEGERLLAAKMLIAGSSDPLDEYYREQDSES